MKDDAIALALKNRNGMIMNYIVEKYSRLLWSIVSAVLKNVGSEQDVEECVADVFVSLWEHPEKFDPQKGTLKSLLCIIARSRAIDRYRQITRHSTVSLEEVVLVQNFGMQEAMIQEESRKELWEAVNALGEPGREILVRRYYYSQKPREIAMALGLTVKQVDNSLYRSKRILREALQEVRK